MLARGTVRPPRPTSGGGMATTNSAPLIRLFGGAAVVVGGTILTPPSGKPATAFAALALAGGRGGAHPGPHRRHVGRPAAGVRPRSRAHPRLGPAAGAHHWCGTGADPRDRPGRLPSAPGARAGRRAATFCDWPWTTSTDEDIAAALSTSAAPLLSGCDTEFAESWRLRISEQRTLLQHQGWSRRVDSGDSSAVLPDVRAAVAADPLWEGGVLLLARALDDTGRREEALSTLDRYRRQLADELGLTPSRRVTLEHQQLLRGTAPAHAHIGRAPPPAPPPDRVTRGAASGATRRLRRSTARRSRGTRRSAAAPPHGSDAGRCRSSGSHRTAAPGGSGRRRRCRHRSHPPALPCCPTTRSPADCARPSSYR